MRRPPPRSTLFPYTTLFRSAGRGDHDRDAFSPVYDPYRGAAGQRRAHRGGRADRGGGELPCPSPSDRKSTRLNSSHMSISYAVFCLKKKRNIQIMQYLNLLC